MKVYEAPQTYTGPGPSLFLAGGITGCPDWQQELLGLLSAAPLRIFNPRRANFPIHDPSAAAAQIAWEYEYLRRAWAVSFWFPCETLNPIVLYELGAWSMTRKPLFVGVHPDYQRRQDVEIQTDLQRPEVQIVSRLDTLAEQIRTWVTAAWAGKVAGYTVAKEARPR